MLTLPLVIAAVTAGLAGGVHCVGMCGGIAVMLSRPAGKNAHVIPIQPMQSLPPTHTSGTHRFYLHLGRICLYMLVGAVFGAMGAAGMMIRPSPLLQQVLFVIGNAALILLGLRLLGMPIPIHSVTGQIALLQQKFFSSVPLLSRPQSHPFIAGLMWGCLPCGLLYSVAPFALFSGSIVSGALLLLIFGIAALPHLLFAEGIVHYARQSQLSSFFRFTGATMLILIGVVGIWYSDMKNMPDFLCIIPT